MRDKNFWHRIGYGSERHEPWKAARQTQRQEHEAYSRRAAPVDRTLAYLHVAADVGDPVDNELTKLGVEPNNSFKSLRRPVDHTLDYLHLPADHGDPVISGGARGVSRGMHDELAFERVPESRGKVDMTALDTIKSFETYEPKDAHASWR